MERRTLRTIAVGGLAVVLAVVGLAVTLMPRDSQGFQAAAQRPIPVRRTVLSYAAKFVCLEPLPPGRLSFGPVTPILREHTEVLIHNPQPLPVTFYKKAVLAPLQSQSEVEPGRWNEEKLKPDHAVRVDCDEIAKLLTGNPAATFIGRYGIGVKVEGFVVIGIGPQTAAGALAPPFLDVTAEYNKGSEVLKKDINYQPWWTWWWWPLPWRLGYAYQRIVPIQAEGNIDCRGALYDQLRADVRKEIVDPSENQLTLQALDRGRGVDPTTIHNGDDTSGGLGGSHALVAMIGRCDKIDVATASVDYVLLSSDTSTDADPRGQETVNQVIKYPWHPGRWYDLTVVVPQNRTIDLDDYIRQWLSAQWRDVQDDDTDRAEVRQAMSYFFPWWCGWGYWWWWWWGHDCIDIGVGEGESIDVEQITPTRVVMPKWPPQP